MQSDFLMHYGIKGMHWGVRRFQEAGSSKRTPAGKKRYKTAHKTAKYYRNNLSEALSSVHGKKDKKIGYIKTDEFLTKTVRKNSKVASATDALAKKTSKLKKIDDHIEEIASRVVDGKSDEYMRATEGVAKKYYESVKNDARGRKDFEESTGTKFNWENVLKDQRNPEWMGMDEAAKLWNWYSANDSKTAELVQNQQDAHVRLYKQARSYAKQILGNDDYKKKSNYDWSFNKDGINVTVGNNLASIIYDDAVLKNNMMPLPGLHYAVQSSDEKRKKTKT